MVAANDNFIRSIDEMLAKVGELAAALESLPRDLTIRISYEEIGRPDVLSNEVITRTIKDVNIPDGSTPESLLRTIKDVNVPVGATSLPPVTENIREKVTGGFGDLGQQVANIDAESRALQQLNAEYAAGGMAAREYIAAKRELVAAQFMEANLAARAAKAQQEADAGLSKAITVADELGASWRRVGGDGRDLSASMVQVISETNATTGAQQRLFAVDGAGAAEMQKLTRAQQEGAMTAAELDAEIKKTTPDVAQFSTVMAGAAAALARSNSILALFRPEPAAGGMKALAAAAAGAAIPLGLAAFGITGIGTAIHLVIMGVAEFLAVFLPAMYAAAAGAYVMAQGVQLVAQHVNATYTAAESLGPLVGKTAGDMLGLGHSMQTAQDLANPGVYELFGEAIKGIGSQSKTGADGLSNLGRMGLNVTNMLDAFGAKVVTDLQGPLGATLNQLLSQAVQDLREFGQILGNVGHAILSFAAAMPGAAELALRVADGISQVIKWVSQLPAPLLTAVLLFEELYRWSGILAGGFGLLGRGIALLGTLGIPVFLAIGKNVAQMLANVVLGVGGLVANLGGVASKMAKGLGFAEGADKIGMAASGAVGKLGALATFLTGPWGIAIGLAAVAAGIFVVMSDKMTTSTQRFITSLNQAVSSADNLNALNVISQSMAQNNVKLAASQSELTQATAAYNAHIHDAGRTLATYNAALMGAQQSVKTFSDEQHKLTGDALNVVQGAGQISKAYGVDFTTALGLADMAGIKLASSMGKNGQLTAQANLQVASMILGYEKMDQTGGILANTMNVVNIAAGIQASKVSQTNQAWDQFIAMGTSLTGTFTQLNLDLQQMGNQAPAVGKKITAFTGDTQMSVGQISQALTSFSGTSAQVWQGYNQSVTQANKFTDALRVAAVAGVVSQQQYGQATASVVQQLQPYASSSKAALAELMMISQEAGGPAYDSTKNLSANYQSLKNWTDKNAVSSSQFAGMLTTMTTNLTNVSAVAKQFAGTLQTDVLNAMASAGADTARITTLTQAYTTALSQNGTQSPVTSRAQDNLTTALESFGFKAKDITQIEQILTTTYGKNQASSSTLEGQTTKTKDAFEKYSGQLGINKTKADELWNNTVGKGVNAFDILHRNTDLSRTKFEALSRQLGISKGDADKLYDALHKLPPNTFVTVTEKGTGLFTITGTGIAASQGKGGSGNAAGGLATGGLIPGYGGGDKHPALLEGGEAVVPKHLVRAIAPFLSANRVPGFASGGIVDRFSGNDAQLGTFTANESAKFENTFTTAMKSSMTSAMKAAVAAAQQAMIGTGLGGMGDSGARTHSAAVAQAYARSLLSQYHWGQDQMAPLIKLWNQESGWSAYAVNASSGAYGIPQSLGHGHPFNLGDYKNQIIWGLNYIRATYTTPAGAWAHEVAHNWYDNGGFLPPGLSLAYNGTGQPERVSPPGGEGGVIQATFHIHNEMNGKQLWTAMQQETFRYNVRNRGQITGGMSNLNK